LSWRNPILASHSNGSTTPQASRQLLIQRYMSNIGVTPSGVEDSRIMCAFSLVNYGPYYSTDVSTLTSTFSHFTT